MRINCFPKYIFLFTNEVRGESVASQLDIEKATNAENYRSTALEISSLKKVL